MKNEYEIRGDHVAIFLKRTKGRAPLVCLIDTADLEKVSSISGSWVAMWHAKINNFYVVACCSTEVNGKKIRLKGSSILIHRLVTDAPRFFEVDHIDRLQTLDNRRSNLRVATRQQNALNSKRAVAKSVTGGWQIDVTVNGKCYNLGTYASEYEATMVRLGAALLADRLVAAPGCGLLPSRAHLTGVSHAD